MITVYAGAAFVIIELINNVTEPLRLPDWTPTLVIILLLIGFPIAVIFSWVYDIHPEGGIVKTAPVDNVMHENILKSSNSWKIASYISFFVIVAMVCILLYPKIFKPDSLRELRDEEGMISLAVLPFDNLTGDSSLYYWQNGISEYLINSLGNSDQLAVSSSQVVSDVLESARREVNAASLSPDIARRTASKINATTYITGNFIGKENNTSIMLNLVDTEDGELIWSTRVNGDLGMDYQAVLDHLSDTVRNYMEIRALEDKVEIDLTNAYPKSAKAYRFYIDGLNAIMSSQYENAIESLKEAYEIDTTFTFAAFYLAYAYNFGGLFHEDQEHWIRRAHQLKNNLPPVYRPWLEWWYASFITEDLDDVERYCNMMYEAALHSRLLLFDLATTYDQFLKNHAKSIQTFKKIEALNELWEDDWRYDYYYSQYSVNLLYEEQTEEALTIIEKGLEINPDNEDLLINTGGVYIITGDTAALNRTIEQYRSWVKEKGRKEAVGEYGIGLMYTRASDSLNAIPHFRKSYELDPEHFESLSLLIQCQLYCNINTEECLRLAQSGYEQFPDIVDFPYEIGVSLYMLGRNEEALSMLKIAYEEYYRYGILIKELTKEVERTLALQE